MIRVAFRGTVKEHLTALAIGLLFSAFCLLLSGVPAHGADGQGQSLKPYNPFDDPKPAVPQEMLSDKRLDLKVKVYARNKNLGDLLGDLSRVSGVKLSADPKLAAEQPILFFRSRALRDVLAELSGFYGYTWTARPDRGGSRYELIEEIGHVRLRKALVEEGRKRSDAMLLDFAEKYLEASADDPKIKEMSWTNSTAYQSLFGSYGKYGRDVLAAAGMDMLARALEGEGVSMGFGEASPAMQTALCGWMNGMNEMGRRWRQSDQPAPVPVDPAGMASETIEIRRAEGGPAGVSRFEFAVTVPNGSRNTLQWPSYQIRYSEMDVIAGWSSRGNASPTEALPSDITVTPAIPKTRLWLTTADVLQAISEQSGRDVIAESPRQEQQQELFAGVPLDKLVSRICRGSGLSCQADGKAIRLRRTEWYSQQTAAAVPSELVESCWKDLEKTGKLSSANLLALANLSPEQAAAPALRDISGARDALRSPDAIRLWALLSAAPDGLPVSKLTGEQRRWLNTLTSTRYSREPSEPIMPEDVDKGVLTLTTEKPAEGGQGGFFRTPSEFQQINLKSGDKTLLAQPIYLTPPLGDDERKQLIAGRKAERDSNIIKAVR